MKLEICYIRHSICEQGKKRMPKASSGPRGFVTPWSLLQEKKEASQALISQNRPGFQDLKEAAAGAELRVFSPSGTSRTRWKTCLQAPWSY